MPTTVRRTSASYARWLLPLLLTLLIVAILGVFVFGSRIKSLAAGPTSSPTSQPRTVKVVVTATPATSGTSSTQASSGGAPTATPGGQGISTPLPHATACPTQVGLKLCMITRPMSQVQALQAGADRGDPHYTYYLNPVLVVEKNLGYYGFGPGVSLLSPTQATPAPTSYVGQDGRPLVDVKIQYQGKQYQVSLAQPGIQGPKGIWVIVTILPL